MTQEEFRKGITEYGLYRDLLEKIIDKELASKGTERQIEKNRLMPIMRTDFGMELSDSRLTDGITTFMKTLEAAGLGEYVVGRRGGSTRIEVIDEFEEEAKQLIQMETAEEKETAEAGAGEESGTQESEDAEGGKEAGGDTEGDGSGEQASMENIIENLDGDIANESEFDISISIEISSQDWDSDEVIQVIEELKEE